MELKQTDIDRVKSICSLYNNNIGELINILNKVQNTFEYISDEAQNIVAQELNIDIERVKKTVSFYTFLKTTPKGKYPISVCKGTACSNRGAEYIIDRFKKELNIDVGQITNDNKYSLDISQCTGTCGQAVVITVGDETYRNVSPDDITHILSKNK
jgi:NADH-quinone oxidoreductase subunit E/NADP-reducing hydrogenase subunit HndA